MNVLNLFPIQVFPLEDELKKTRLCMDSPHYSIGNNENVVIFFCNNPRIQVQINSCFTKVKTENFICVYSHTDTHTHANTSLFYCVV